MPDPFAVFDLPPHFDLDRALLQQRYIQAAAANHPDRFVDPLEQADAAARSAEINEAYRLLRDPMSRAEALLQRRGGPAGADDKSLPPDLLMEIMEAREALDEAIASGDAEEIERLHGWARDEQQSAFDAVAALFAEDDEAALEQIRLRLNTLRYYQRMLETR